MRPPHSGPHSGSGSLSLLLVLPSLTALVALPFPIWGTGSTAAPLSSGGATFPHLGSGGATPHHVLVVPHSPHLGPGGATSYPPIRALVMLHLPFRLRRYLLFRMVLVISPVTPPELVDQWAIGMGGGGDRACLAF
jgi:hypothetical protein